MNTVRPPFDQALSLLTDLYELTMAYGYWKTGNLEKEAVFHHTFRKNPFGGGFTVACGLGDLIDYLSHFRFEKSDIDYLNSLRGADNKPLFEEAFLAYLSSLKFECDVFAIPEGTVVFPHEPLVRVQGPILQCQILESAILNIVNFQSLVATKAARVCLAAEGEPVLEFGLRRAQGVDGALAASRAAFIGGCCATSNVLAGKVFGIPVRGTHAHSWIMSFDSEEEAFRAYASAMPNNCVFLVDTYDTLEGIRTAIRIGRELRGRGHDLLGIRLDSGDLAYFSIQARRMLDEAGFPGATIIASNELDERVIESLKDQNAKINVWGVGTRLVTAFDEPALGGVYKLAAVRRPGEDWKYRVKLSEQAIKITTPGIMQVRRYRQGEETIADVIYDVATNVDQGCTMIDPLDLTRRKHLPGDMPCTDLLLPIFQKGELVYQSPSLQEIQKNTSRNLSSFHAGIKRFINPHRFPVGLEQSLFERRTNLILQARGEIKPKPPEE